MAASVKRPKKRISYLVSRISREGSDRGPVAPVLQRVLRFTLARRSASAYRHERRMTLTSDESGGPGGTRRGERAGWRSTRGIRTPRLISPPTARLPAGGPFGNG